MARISNVSLRSLTNILSVVSEKRGIQLRGMKRLIRALIALSVILILLCSMAILVGHNQADLPFIPDVARCGGSLCYLGILPGKTLWDDGTKIIRANSQLTPDDSSNNR